MKEIMTFLNKNVCEYINRMHLLLFTVSDSVLSKYKAVRAMVILAILLLAGAIICGILALFVMKKMKMLYFVASGLSVMAGKYIMILMCSVLTHIKIYQNLTGFYSIMGEN